MSRKGRERESPTALRIPAGEIEHLVTTRVRKWLLDPGGIYQATRLPDLSAQRRLITRAEEIGKTWTELPGTRQRAFVTTLIDRIAVGADRIDVHLRPTRLAALLDVAATPLPSAADDEIQILSIPVRLRRSGRVKPGDGREVPGDGSPGARRRRDGVATSTLIPPVYDDLMALLDQEPGRHKTETVR